MKRLLTTCAIVAALVGPAIAQDTPIPYVDIDAVCRAYENNTFLNNLDIKYSTNICIMQNQKGYDSLKLEWPEMTNDV
ncbi:hypothetical protein [Methylocella sp.]|jgi:hypothetical protein|uniref:hypothetical protein n=1 Tax=Methylocella sp. TaxID=1978226 RepID=UPI003C2A84CE